jgi:hypothetical protein
MRILVTGAGLAVTLLVFSCKSTRQVYEEQRVEIDRSEQEVIQSSVSRLLETEYFGDSLTGRVPLPYTVPRSARYQINAGGVSLD